MLLINKNEPDKQHEKDIQHNGVSTTEKTREQSKHRSSEQEFTNKSKREWQQDSVSQTFEGTDQDKQTGRPLSYRKSMELRDIQLSNFRMIKKIIEQPQSSYSADKMRKDWQKKKNLLQSLCQYPFQFDKRAKSSLSNRRSPHQKSKQRVFNHNQVYTIKQLCSINGHMLNVTIELDSSCLRIIASSQLLDRDKYIELQRGEAIELINGECGGSLYKIIERLRFNGRDLQLVASEQQDAEILKRQLEETMEENEKYGILKGRLANLRAKRGKQKNIDAQGIPALRYIKQIEEAELKISRL